MLYIICEIQFFTRESDIKNIRVHPCNFKLENIDKMINNNSPSSGKSIVTEIVIGETNKYKINLNQESFQNVYVILQADNEFLEEYNNGKKIDCIDIQNES